jgi:nucleotide-binding universal stress UspA family protein
LEAPRTAEFTDPTAEPQRLRSEIEEARRAVADHGIDVEAVVAVGNPAEEILNAAEAGGVELIVMGRRGRNAIARFVMGSVSDRVVRHATCDVLVVR